MKKGNAIAQSLGNVASDLRKLCEIERAKPEEKQQLTNIQMMAIECAAWFLELVSTGKL